MGVWSNEVEVEILVKKPSPVEEFSKWLETIPPEARYALIGSAAIASGATTYLIVKKLKGK